MFNLINNFWTNDGVIDSVYINSFKNIPPPPINHEVIKFGERPSSAFTFDLWYFPSPIRPFDTWSLAPSDKATYSIDRVH